MAPSGRSQTVKHFGCSVLREDKGPAVHAVLSVLLHTPRLQSLTSLFVEPDGDSMLCPQTIWFWHLWHAYRDMEHTSQVIFVGMQSAQSALWGCAITAKCKYDKNRCLPAEGLDGDSVMDGGLLGAHLDVKALIIEDHHSHLVVLRPHVENKRILHHQPSTKCKEPHSHTMVGVGV